jgi:hypothetical protein
MAKPQQVPAGQVPGRPPPTKGRTRARNLTRADWEILLGRIAVGDCTPFLGAGASAGTLPLGRDIAERWAKEYKYPFEDSHDLARVAQYVAVMRDDILPKDKLCGDLKKVSSPSSSDGDGDHPHAALAALPLPIYMTTNYDDFMYQALKQAGKRPERELCRWNNHPRLEAETRVLDGHFIPTPAEPVVFHLHGHLDVVESLVLTEDDYLDFVVAASQDPRMLLPHEIHLAIASTSLIFVGYSLADWDFRVLHRGILARVARGQRRLSVTVQLERDDRKQREYLKKYFSALLEVKVFWGNAAEFAQELRRRWEQYARNA